MYRGKVIIVTGASSGIGKAIAVEFALRGASLVMASKNPDNLSQAVNEIKAIGVPVLGVQTNVSSEAECKALIQSAVNEFSKIDVLICNAGISMRALFSDLKMDVFREVMDVNFYGAVYCTKYALPYLLETKGSVVGMLSTAGFRGLPCRSAYSSAKFALNGFFEVIRTENMYKGLHVLIAAPGFTASNIRKSALNANGEQQGESPRSEAKMMTAEYVATRIIGAIHKRKAYLMIPFFEKLVITVNKFFPLFVDKQVYKYFTWETDSPIN
ncbi:SDR family oxidoreductase [Bacteroidota bacterium]